MADEEFSIDKLPVGFQAVQDHVANRKNVDGQYLFRLRGYTMQQIEKITGNVVFAYVASTDVVPNAPPGMITSIEDNDLEPFETLIDHVGSSKANQENVDIFLISNGGSAEAAQSGGARVSGTGAADL